MRTLIDAVLDWLEELFDYIFAREWHDKIYGEERYFGKKKKK